MSAVTTINLTAAGATVSVVVVGPPLTINVAAAAPPPPTVTALQYVETVGT